MILYCTKQTMERYGLKLPEEMQNPDIAKISRETINAEQGDRLLEWGVKLFYFDGKKCLLLMNFASKLMLVLPDMKKDDCQYIGNILANYLLRLYQNDPRMTELLERLFEEHPVTAFSKLTDKSAIASLNHRLSFDLADGEVLREFIRYEPGNSLPTLHSMDCNDSFNRETPTTVNIDGKKYYAYPVERFEYLLRTRYGMPLRGRMREQLESGRLWYKL